MSPSFICAIKIHSAFIISASISSARKQHPSVAMEMEGFKRCRSEMEMRGYTVKSVTTDRHIQIAAYMSKEWDDVSHFYDFWHIAKGKCLLLIVIRIAPQSPM